MKISDLLQPVRAAKSNWSPSERSIEFTPADGSLNARNKCQSTVIRQADVGYIVEYISHAIEVPNQGCENSPEYLQELREHKQLSDRLVAVHRLRPSARLLRSIIGDVAFERLQDMWAREDRRYRWSVAFLIIENFEIEHKPKAIEVFGIDSYQRIFSHASGLLRPLLSDESTKLMDLDIVPLQTVNAWIVIEDEAEMAERSDIDKRMLRSIGVDLSASAMEGLTEEQRIKVRRRAAWLAHRFIMKRQKDGKLICDECGFDPLPRIAQTGIKPRSLLDVHHREPLAEGQRYTTLADFALLCPTCHRLEHARMRIMAG